MKLFNINNLFYIFLLLLSLGCGSNTSDKYPLHKDVTTTLFWVGEVATIENDFITNVESAWDVKWEEHYGGTDDPNNRDGYLPSTFTPLENPFYFALPYNDFNDDLSRKEGIDRYIPWFRDEPNNNISICKNRWIKITKNDKVVYAQWEDVGPFGEDDQSYVFGTSKPSSQENSNAGLDVSPAVKDYLGIAGIDTTSWQFVDENQVPDGAWKQIVTTSQVIH
jgi:hypothetical protein